jgi:hypothetical protein
MTGTDWPQQLQHYENVFPKWGVDFAEKMIHVAKIEGDRAGSGK